MTLHTLTSHESRMRPIDFKVCFTLRDDKGHISPYCKNITELYIRVHFANRRVKTLLNVNEPLYYTLHMHIYCARKDVLKEILDGVSKKRG